tara:strand:+ start:1442 stop:1636 length:195 start_codon:yes stop_codon:yes gene_type:complete
MIVVKKKLPFEIIRFSAAGAPLFSIMLGVLENDGFSVIFAGICFFYFPFVRAHKDIGVIVNNET